MGSCASIGVESEEGLLDTADECAIKGHSAKAAGDIGAAIDWYLEALRLRAEVKRRKSISGLSSSYIHAYNEPLVRGLLDVAQTYFSIGREEEAYIYFLHAHRSIDQTLTNSMKLTNALENYVVATVGLSLIYVSTFIRSGYFDSLKLEVGSGAMGLLSRKVNDRRTCSTADTHLLGYNTLFLAENVVKRATEVVARSDGHRSSFLVPLMHILARVFVIQNRFREALRAMQWCLGLVMNNEKASDAAAVIAFTKNVIIALKRELRRWDAAHVLQRWWRRQLRLVARKEQAAADREPAFVRESADAIFRSLDVVCTDEVAMQLLRSLPIVTEESNDEFQPVPPDMPLSPIVGEDIQSIRSRLRRDQSYEEKGREPPEGHLTSVMNLWSIPM